MKTPKNTLSRLTWSLVFIVSTNVWAADSPAPFSVAADQAVKRERMMAQGTDASFTVLPVVLAGRPFDRVTEVVALGLEKQGLKTIELGATAFVPVKGASKEELSEALAAFIRQNPPSTEYALYSEFNGSQQTGLNELRAIIVDKSGAVLWTEHQTACGGAHSKAMFREPLTMALFLVDRLSLQLGLNADTAKAAKPGKFARLMEERCGLPSKAERDALPARRQAMVAARQTATVAVVCTGVPDHSESEIAARVAESICDAQLFKSASSPIESVILARPKKDRNEMKMLWDLARGLKDYVKTNQPSADYILGIDYRFNNQAWERGYVHFVICDRQGEWVLVDLQNSDHADYQSIKPTSKILCEKLLLKRLQGHLLSSEHASNP